MRLAFPAVYSIYRLQPQSHKWYVCTVYWRQGRLYCNQLDQSSLSIATFQSFSTQEAHWAWDFTVQGQCIWNKLGINIWTHHLQKVLSAILATERKLRALRLLQRAARQTAGDNEDVAVQVSVHCGLWGERSRRATGFSKMRMAESGRRDSTRIFQTLKTILHHIEENMRQHSFSHPASSLSRQVQVSLLLHLMSHKFLY